jgi:hypothetical protein
MKLRTASGQEESFSECGYLLATLNVPGRFGTGASWLAAVVFALALTGVGALAQSLTGDVYGKVTDANGAVIPGARVTVRNVGTDARRQTTTDDGGEFRLASLPAADYQVEAEATGFVKGVESFKLAVGQGLAVNLVLKTPGLVESVMVSDEAGVSVQTDSAALGGVIGSRQITELPLNGRNIDQLALLEPGVFSTTNRSIGGTIHGTQININGSMGRSSRYLLDGTNVADTFNNGLGSTADTFLGVDAVREFRVLTNSYGPEYGQASGGVVTIVTKSGTNDFHGSAFEFLRNDRFDARNFFDAEKPSFKRNQFGFSAGGALVKDRTFLFGASEWLRESLGLTKVTVVPSLDARRGRLPSTTTPGQFTTVTINPDLIPYLNLFPLPNGRDFGTGLAELSFPFKQTTDEAFYQMRLDHKLTSANSFFARYTFDDAERTPPASFPAWDVLESSRNQYLTTEDTHVFTNALVNTFRFSYARTNLFANDRLTQDFPASLILIPGRPEPQLTIGGMPTTGGGERPPRSSLQLQNIYSWSDDMSLVKGGHLLKWGVLVDRVQNLIETKSYLGGRFNFPGIRQFLLGTPSNLTIAAPGSEPRQYLFHTRFGVYISDDFRVMRDLTLNLGLRLEFSTNPTEKFGHIVGLPDPLHDTSVTVGKLYENHKQNWAPRVGLAWQPWGDSRTVVRGGCGIFYDIHTIPFLAQKINGNPPFNSRIGLPNSGLHPNLNVAATSLDVSLPAYDWQTPHALHYNLTVEREVLHDTVITVGYAGSRGINTVRTGEINTPVPQVLPDGRLFFSTTAPRRNPRLGSIVLMRPDGNSWYNAMQFRAHSRLGKDMQLQASYTFSRTIDETQGTISGDSTGSQPLAWNVFDRGYDRGLADFHRKHNFVGQWIVNLPYSGEGGGLSRAVFGGWSLSGIVTLKSGNPFTPGIQADWTGTRFASDARGSDRPNVRAGFNADNIILGGPDQFFNPNAFELPLRGTFGNLGRNVLIGPGLAMLDMSAHKNVRLGMLGDGGNLQFRVEAFNLFNHANFNPPTRIVFNGAAPGELPVGNAGRITSTSTSARQIQLGLRLSW